MTATAPHAPIELLPFWCPIEPAIHPQVEEICQRAVQWLDSAELYRDDVHRAWEVGVDGGNAMSRIYPDGITDRVLLSAFWLHWIFYLDDSRFDVPLQRIGTSEACCDGP